MQGHRREQTDPRSIQLNQGIVESALDELLYRPRFPATVLIPQADSGMAFSNVASAGYLSFPKAGGNIGGRCSIPTPRDFWVKGNLTVRIQWSGDAASLATNLSWQVNMALTTGLGVPTGVSGPAAILPGPAVVNAIQDYTFMAAATFPVDSSIINLGVNIMRNGAIAADTYAGEGRLFGFQIIYTPAGGH